MNEAKRPTIAAVLIVKNEEELLPRCLESIKGVDEIIVCDTGSTDNTVEVAKKYTDKVFTDYEWQDHFAAARNHAKSKTACDWILSIDADEYLHSFEELRMAVDTAETMKVYAVDVILEAESNKQHHFFPRLFKNHPVVWWEGAAHNHLTVRGEPLGNVIITYGWSPAHEKDPNRTLRILEKVTTQRDDAVREMFYLGREYFYRLDYIKCIDILTKYTEKSKFLGEKADAYLIMGRCYWQTQQGDLARHMAAQALIINPHFKEAAEFMSEIVWPQHAQQWKNMAATATNEGVLFRR